MPRLSFPKLVAQVVPPAPGTTIPGTTQPGVPAEAAPATSPAARGTIEGTIVDAKTGEPLIEAQVTVVRLRKRVLTDIEGHYQISVPPGTYDIRVFAELRAARRLTGIKVQEKQVTRLDVALGAESEDKVAIEEVVVVARPDTATEAVQLVRRQKAVSVSDAVSAEQIARTPDTSASEAVKRVVGATIQDGRYVVIRGLGGRYSLALLNGVPLPSPDPDLPTAPLDIFPAALLANLTVAKTFTPDLPGNFAGGALIIETRDFPSRFTLRLKLGTSADTQATFKSLNTYEGGGLDFLGYDDGTRALPGAVPRDQPATDDRFAPNALADIGRSFSNRWTLFSHKALPNLNFGATVGDTIQVAHRKLGYLATVGYGQRWSRQQAHIQLVGERLSDGRYLPSVLQLDSDAGVETTSLGALANVGYMLSSTHRLTLIALYTHNTEDSATEVSGTENNGNVARRVRFRFLERQLEFNQLAGEHAIAGGKLLLGWQAHLAFTSQNEPDTRDLYRRRDDDAVERIGSGVGTAERQFGTLHDVTGGAGVDATVPLSWVRIKGGGSFSVSPRESRVRRFHFDVDPSIAGQPSRAVFAPGNIGQTVLFEEATTKDDAFDATRKVYAGYLMGDLFKWEPFRVIAGARYEVAPLELTLGKGLGVAPTAVMRIDRTDRALLPAASLVMAISQRSNARIAYGATVARPHLRELSPTPYFDYVRRRVVSGDPTLEQTRIHNGDLRWETFLSGSEVVAGSLFFKYFDKPIERTVVTAGDGQNLSFANAVSAKSYGLELEARLAGSRLGARLEPFYLGANFSYILSSVETGDAAAARALEGQSPYVGNVELGFRRAGTHVSLLYNVFGRRIVEVGTAGSGDVYEQPIHRLDVSFSQQLPRRLSLKVSGTNLLNQRTRFVQNGIEIYSYRMGIAAFATLEWAYEGATR